MLYTNPNTVQGGPAQYNFWDLEKIVLCEICTSWDYIANFHQYGFYTYGTKNCTSGIRNRGDCTSGGPSVIENAHPLFHLCTMLFTFR